MQNSFKPKSYHLWILIMGLFVLIYSIQISYDSWFRHSKPKLNITYNEVIAPNSLDADFLKKSAVGFENLLADYYWLSAIQYYGGGDPYGDYLQLDNLLNNVVTLNPKFEYPYIFALLSLPTQDQADSALALAEKGRQSLPENWQIPYYMGAVYHIDKKDYANAGKYLNIAAEKPGVLPVAKLLAGIYYSKANEREIAYQIYTVIYETSKDSYTKERAKEYLEHLEIMNLLEQANQIYKTKFNKYPINLKELVDKGIIPELPKDPINVELITDPETGKITEKDR